MRDPERIDKIIGLLRILWKRYPDMRLGQLLENYIFGHHLERMRDGLQWGCLFHVEDEIVVAKLGDLLLQDQQP